MNIFLYFCTEKDKNTLFMIRIIHFFVGAITGSVGNLLAVSDTYKAIRQEVYDLQIPTTATDKKKLFSDRRQVVSDLADSLEQYKENGKATKKTTNC